jgi:hypothetical protein
VVTSSVAQNVHLQFPFHCVGDNRVFELFVGAGASS